MARTRTMLAQTSFGVGAEQSNGVGAAPVGPPAGRAAPSLSLAMAYE